jgi:hypothetical protein
MRLFQVVALLSLLPVAGWADSTYQITFKAFTAFGDPIAIRVVTLMDPMHHRELVAQCTDAVCTGIPEGPYTYSVAVAATGRTVEGSAVVYRTNQVVPVDVGTPTADLDDSDFPTLRGQISHVRDTSKLWIRLQQLYGDISAATKVSKDGSFVIDQVRPGNWMLLVFSDGKLVHFEPLVCKMTGNQPLKINISGLEPLIKARNTNHKHRDSSFLGE